MKHTLLLCLAGPMQSWGTKSRFDERDTELEPSKSGVIGLLCAALGVPRTQTQPVLDLAQLAMGVRVDREGILQRDYHTAIVKETATRKDVVVSHRYYLSDAVFLVGLESGDEALLNKLHNALHNPYWTLSLGRKSFVPSRSVYLKDGLKNQELKDALCSYPWLTETEPRRLVLESARGSLRTDQPLSSFAARKFGTRYVESRAWSSVCT